MSGAEQAPAASPSQPGLPRGYELSVLLLLGLAFGFAYFDRMAMTFLGPFVEKDLSLSKTEIGALGSGLSVTWALGAYFVGRWSDSIGRRKPFLLAMLVIFSLCSVMSGLAWSFGSLFAARVVMGAAEGPFLPICLAIMVAASADSRKGLNAGIVQNVFGAIIGTALAPIVLVWLADTYDWRIAFYLAGVPGLILAVLIWRLIAEPPRSESRDRPGAGAEPHQRRALLAPVQAEFAMLFSLLRARNILVCSIVSCFAVGSAVIGSIFMPFYLDGPRGFEPATWKWMMAVVGFCPAVGALVFTGLSDRIGRKPPMIAGAALMALAPLSLLYIPGGAVSTTALVFLGWMGMGIFPLFMGVVPAETLGRARAATAMGLVVAVGELTGGFLGPLAGGAMADRFGLQAPLQLQAGLAIAGAVAALLLVETRWGKGAGGANPIEAAA
jgi:MFS family permease